MSQTYAILSKDTFKTLYRALNDSVAAGNLMEDEKEEIQDALDKVLYNGTTRKWFQVIDYNEESFYESLKEFDIAYGYQRALYRY